MLKQISIVFRSLVGLVAIALAFGIFGALFVTKEGANRATDLEPPRVVPTMRVERAMAPLVFKGYGVARSMDAVEVAAEVSGRVVERPRTLEDGVAIGEGDLLLRIDPTTYQARVDALQAQIEQVNADLSALEVEEASLAERIRLTEEQAEASQRDLDRAREAYEAGAGNQSQVDARIQSVRANLVTLEGLRERFASVPSRRASFRAQLTSRRGDLRSADADLERTTIRSPISGTVQRVDVEIGEFLRVGDPIARVVDVDRIEVPVRLPVGSSGVVEIGDEVELRPDGPGDAAWRGTVSRVAPETDADRRTLTVFVEVDAVAGSGDRLRPGRFVEAIVTSGRVMPRLVIPRRVIDDERALIGEPIDPVTARADAESSGLDRVDFDAATRLLRVREVEVRVERYIDGLLPDLHPRETEWAVLDTGSVAASRGINDGDLLLMGDTQRLHVGMIIDGGVPGAEPTVDGAEAETPRNGDAS